METFKTYILILASIIISVLLFTNYQANRRLEAYTCGIDVVSEGPGKGQFNILVDCK